MNTPGVYDLGSISLTVPLTAQVITVGSANDQHLDPLDGMLSASIQIRFAYGSGGATCKVYVQTSLDQGTTWVDVICATFTTASGNKAFNLSGLTPRTMAVTPADGALADDTAVDGILGDWWRAKVTSTGTYANTSLAIRLTAR
jgi:hypothetical protein